MPRFPSIAMNSLAQFFITDVAGSRELATFRVADQKEAIFSPEPYLLVFEVGRELLVTGPFAAAFSLM